MGSDWGKWHLFPASPLCVHGPYPQWVGEFFRTSPWRAGHQQLWSHFSLYLYNPTLQASREKMLWYSANRAWVATWFLLDHPSRSDKSSCWKSTFLLHLTDILVHWIPCISSSFSKSSSCNIHLGHCIHSYYLGDFNTLGDSDQYSHQIFHYDCNSLAPSSHFGVGIHDTQAMRQAGSITPFRVCIITCMLLPKSMVLVWPYMILDEKASISSLCVILTASFKSVRSTVWFAVTSLLMESSAWWHTNKWDILNPFKEADNSSISLSLITLMIWLMVGVPRVTGTWDPNVVESGMTRATWTLS